MNPTVSVVLPVGGRASRIARWAESLADEADEVLLVPARPRVAAAAEESAAHHPGVRVLASAATDRDGLVADGLAAATGEVTVVLHLSAVPSRGWLVPLVSTLTADPGAGMTQALLLDRDWVVLAAGGDTEPLLNGRPDGDATRLAGLDLPGPWPGAVAVRTRQAQAVGGAAEATLARRLEEAGHGPVRLAPESRLRMASLPRNSGTPAPERTHAAWQAAGYDAPHGRPLRVREHPPALRWSLDIAAGAGPGGRRWGDHAFARSLATALTDLGQWVTLDHPETRGRASAADDDVHLVLRGLDLVPRRPHGVSMLWVISHPDEVTAAECAERDVVLAASTSWAARHTASWGREVVPLLQCTDPARFHPGLAAHDSGPELLFVGNARGGQMRPSAVHPTRAGLPLTLVGRGWPQEFHVAATHVSNEEVGRLYASAGIVLNDHWEDMRQEGFVSNRVFDVLACGGRLLTDEVVGLDAVAPPGALLTWRTPEELVARCADRDAWPDREARLETAARIAREHSFAARAATLLDHALRARSRRRGD